MHVETDTYCDGCAYNLHGQTVTRDERLGILVCRCPECGKWHAAGRETSATRDWQRRLGVGLLAGWVLLCLYLFGMMLFGIGACVMGHVGIYSEPYWLSRAGPGGIGAAVYRHYVTDAQMRRLPNGTGAAGLDEIIEGSDAYDAERTELGWPAPMLAMLAAAGGLSVLFGGTVAIALSHLRRPGWAVLLPAAACVGCGCFLASTDLYSLMRGWILVRAAGYAVWAAGFAYLGLLIGRRVVRGILTVLLPPRARRAFEFLWAVDGKPTQAVPTV